MSYLIHSQSFFLLNSSVFFRFFLFFSITEFESEENQQARRKRGLHEEGKGTLKRVLCFLDKMK